MTVPALLETEDLHAQYGSTVVLHGLRFAVETGGITTILGANGAGKTTTLRAVCGMVKTSGQVRFDGQRIDGRATEDIVRLGIAHTPEGRGTFAALSVEENLTMGALNRRPGSWTLPRVYDLFPTSPLAGEGLYRAADIRWQMDRSDIMTRPSAREREAYMRGQIDEEWMKLVIKKFPGTKWADLAAFHMLENKLCGDWQGASKCPEKEADMYEKYAKEHEQSSAAPEALYQAAWRQSALMEIYKTEANQKKSDAAKSRALDLAQKILGQYSQSQWALRAQTLVYDIQQSVATYGSSND